MAFDTGGLSQTDVLTIPMTTLPHTLRGTAVTVIGDAVVLSVNYDPDQFWLPFMHGVILVNQDRPDPWLFGTRLVRRVTPGLLNTSGFDGMDFERVDNRNKFDWTYYRQPTMATGVHQYVLPFRETRKLETTDMSRLRMTRFPAFDRDEEGNIFSTEVEPRDHERLLAWAEQNCTGRYTITEGQLFVEREDEAVALRLLI